MDGEIDYDGRIFAPTHNSESGEVTGDTRFLYRQAGDVLWATYDGGGVSYGHMIGRVAPDGGLFFRYHHLSADGEPVSGECRSTLEILEDGRYRLHEAWRWTSGDGSSGTSVIDEIPAEGR
ncbi:MAG: n-acetylglutamate synthase [Pseudomonadota bacterium]